MLRKRQFRGGVRYGGCEVTGIDLEEPVELRLRDGGQDAHEGFGVNTVVLLAISRGV